MSTDMPPVGAATEQQPPADSTRRQQLFAIAVSLGLILATLAVYAQVGGFDFVNYDDNSYVFENPHVRAGLTLASIKWALTATVVGNWAPVTLLSHLLDAQLFGMQSGMHHLVNALFHACSAVLLFLVLQRATGRRVASAFVAFVFALHPLHVESVAWISERKDVLSAFFWLLALYAYLRYCEKPGNGRYLLVVAPFCLGLMSKPMVVTFPFALLLFDAWPLRRARWPQTFIEKLPLIALAGGATGIAYFVQKSAGAVEAVPLAMRIENAFLSYVTYIEQLFWPVRLACFYPYPQSIPAWRAAAAYGVVLAVSALAILTWRTRPYLAVGWSWYLGTLVPVIGVLQVGMQAHADRYMYIPMIGLLIMLAWGSGDLVKKWPRTKLAVAATAIAACAACMALAWRQTAYWENSETLFEHALEVTQDNWLAEIDLGIYLNRTGRAVDAIPHFENALRIKPDEATIHDSLGASLASLGDCGAAIPHFQAALRARPKLAQASYNLGYCLMLAGDDAGAIPYFEAAVRSQPDMTDAHIKLAAALAKTPGRGADAVAEYETALRLAPDDASTHVKLGQLLASMGRTREAIAHLETAQSIHPDPVTSQILADLRAAQR